MCSTDDTAKAAEGQSMQFQSQLMNVFQQQYGSQTGILNYLKQTMTNAMNNPQGFDAGTLAAMKTNAVDTATTQYTNAQKQLNNQQFAFGGENLPSGVNAMQQGALAQAQAGNVSNAMQNIDLQNANLKNQNYWNAASALSGTAAQYNPNGTAASANGAGGTTASLSNAVTASQANGMSPFNSLLGAAGGMGAAYLYKHG
jgi:hypothetical protein